MAILRPDGKPVNSPIANGPVTMGFIILRQELNTMIPMNNDKGNLAIFPTAQAALDIAGRVADAELRPKGDQKIVTPQQKSHVYFVAALQAVGQIQGNLKDPSQLNAPAGTPKN
jgi:hypothetical protein